jgi:hypothetical protein
MIVNAMILVDSLHFESETMPSTLGRNAVLIHVVDSAFNRHTSIELLVEAYENETKECGHTNRYESSGAVDAHGHDVTGATGSVHYVVKEVNFRTIN